MGLRIREEQLQAGAEKIATSLLPIGTQELANAMGVAYQTALKYQPVLEQLVEEYRQVHKQDRIEQLKAVEHQALTRLADPNVWEKAQLRDIGVVYGILHDKRALATGQATSHIHVLHEIASREQFARRLLHLLPDVVGTVAPGDGHDESAK